jgi:hypothetical protein
MKKISILIMFLIISSLSAFAVTVKHTVVDGIIYQSDDSTVVQGASVTVKCYSSSVLTGQLSTTSNSIGMYAVEFDNVNQICAQNSDIVVEAEKNSAKGKNTGTVDHNTSLVYVGIVNVSIPEFTAIGASLALLGAGAVYFARKRK